MDVRSVVWAAGPGRAQRVRASRHIRMATGMSKAVKAGVLGLVIAATVWSLTLWQWRRTPEAVSGHDIFWRLLVLPLVLMVVAWLAWPFAVESFHQQEHSPSAGGLIRWPIKVAMPIGFALLGLQGLAELLRRIEFLRGRTELDIHYERPLQ